MHCTGCGAEINENAQACPKCGCPTQKKAISTKSRTVYIILALFFGDWGLHNFYAGRTDVAVKQLLLCLFCGISWIWAIHDIFTVKKDGEGRDFA